MDGGDLFSDADQPLNSNATALKNIIDILTQRGCSDLTTVIDRTTSGTSPVAGGGFCDVYQGVTIGGSKIAIKCLRIYDGGGRDDHEEQRLKTVAKELYYWSKLKHRNVLPLMGLAIFRGRISMISSWIDNRDIISYLSLNPGAVRIDLCKGVCAGLTYIHSCNMVHGDLKASNVMVSRNGTAMITDFGNSQMRDLTLHFTSATSKAFSVRWVAPEILLQSSESHISKKADVYAYGMTALEIMTGAAPYSKLTENQVLVAVTIHRRLPKRPAWVDEELWNVLKYCWTWDQSERPDIATVEEHLRFLCLRSDTKVPRSGIASDGSLDAENPSATSRFDGRSALDSAGGLNYEKIDSMQKEAARCHARGWLVEAESVKTEVLAAVRQVFGDDHPDTLWGMADLALTYRRQGRLADAESLEVEVLAARKRVLGGDHPDTLASMANLAATYWEQGRLADAESLEVEVLAACKRVLGDDHPDTLMSMGNLAATYRRQGRLADAESLEVEVLAARKRVLGEQYPHTIRSARNLALTYQAQGRQSQNDARMAEASAMNPNGDLE